MSIRTTRFGSTDTALTTAVTIYTVPAGKRALIRSFSAYNKRAATCTVSMEIIAPGAGGGRKAGVGRTVGVNLSVELDPWVVAEQLEEIRVTAGTVSAGNVTLTVAGVLFDLP